jgi:hypothetical protein
LCKVVQSEIILKPEWTLLALSDETSLDLKINMWPVTHLPCLPLVYNRPTLTAGIEFQRFSIELHAEVVAGRQQNSSRNWCFSSECRIRLLSSFPNDSHHYTSPPYRYFTRLSPHSYYRNIRPNNRGRLELVSRAIRQDCKMD